MRHAATQLEKIGSTDLSVESLTLDGHIQRHNGGFGNPPRAFYTKIGRAKKSTQLTLSDSWHFWII
jgi:hypothetical protein